MKGVEKGGTAFDGRSAIARDETAEAYYCHTVATADWTGPSRFFAIWFFPAQRKLAIAAGIILALGMYYSLIMLKLLTLLNDIHPEIYAQAPLMDAFYVPTDLHSERPQSVETLLNVLSVTPMASLVYLLVMGKTKRFCLFALTLAIVYFLKGTFEVVTVLPSCHDGCFARKKALTLDTEGKDRWDGKLKPEEVKQLKLTPDGWSWIFYSSNGLPGCNDMMFSGHTSAVLLSELMLRKTLKEHHEWGPVVSVLLFVVFVTYVYILLALRMHYLVDVLVAIVLGLLLYTHTALRFWMWTRLNKVCGNPTGWDGEEEPLLSKKDKEERV